jgi:hypothetical protein
MEDNFNKPKISKPLDFESKVIIGEKIDTKQVGSIIGEDQQIIGFPKSSAEVAEELIDYLIIHNHQKVARIIIEKARICLSKINSNHNVVIIDQKLQQVELEFSDLIMYFCQEDKGKFKTKFKELKIIIESLESASIKNFLQHILEIIDNYSKNRSKKSFDKKEEFKNFKANITLAFSVLKNLS